jgi:hypothetical protein
MALRMMVYMGLLYQELLKSGQISKKGLLPPVLPIVIYNGQKKWTASRQMADLISPTPLGFEMFRPQLEYFLLDEQRTDETEALKTKNLVAAIIALEKSRSREKLYELMMLLTEWFKDPDQRNIRRIFSFWFKRAFFKKKHIEYEIDESIDKMSEVNTMFVDTVQVWIDEWKVEGKVEGKAYAIIEMLEDGDISYEKALKKITLLRTQLNDEAFWKDIDLRLERFK